MKRLIEKIITQSRWILIPFYLGLILAQTLYAFKFCEELWHLVITLHTLTEAKLMLAVLMLIDITMIANLIKMIITGSYHTFIDKLNGDNSEKIGSGLLKVKMGSSLVGISSIHLLSAFINSENTTDRELIIKGVVHLLFLVSTIGLAYIDYLHYKTVDHSH